jgi:hypothetical protein
MLLFSVVFSVLLSQRKVSELRDSYPRQSQMFQQMANLRLPVFL